jgi:hypothetical protein
MSDQTNAHPETLIEGLAESLSGVAADLALALGLSRAITLLPLSDPAVDEIERLIGSAYASLSDLRRRLDEQTIPPGGPS